MGAKFLWILLIGLIWLVIIVHVWFHYLLDHMRIQNLILLRTHKWLYHGISSSLSIHDFLIHHQLVSLNLIDLFIWLCWHLVSNHHILAFTSHNLGVLINSLLVNDLSFIHILLILVALRLAYLILTLINHLLTTGLSIYHVLLVFILSLIYLKHIVD